ncbi:hypothetical protein [Ancylobacter rudongensis]|uniref:Uncharacterized protein n=1 Tax=Ancylobacter rudongensis TaxID=177413 RepID=A0A1G4UQ59_9HYPH|nr:hypothetical protein [Ancylobacter rudongensis]SCW95798.1 hypothetical protein SAMN05660859_0121 [Ancylobacter rudongensis]
MGVKLTGAEYKAFIASDWGHPDAYWDDTSFKVDGQKTDDIDDQALNDDAIVEILAGYFFADQKMSTRGVKATTFVKKWLKKHTTFTVTVIVPKERRDELMSLLEGMASKGVSVAR